MGACRWPEVGQCLVLLAVACTPGGSTETRIAGAQPAGSGAGRSQPLSDTSAAAGHEAAARHGGRFPWDMTGVVGSGQSLSVGAQASDVAATAPLNGNLKLALGGVTVPPFNPAAPGLSLVPLVEPIRPLATSYPSAYPDNIYGETPHTAMASQISALVHARFGAEYVTVHSVVGENGQGMTRLEKAAVETVNGATSAGRAYAATLFEVEAIARLAKARAESYGVGAIILTHGETDAGNSAYQAELVQLWKDYNQDLKAITGQSESIPLLVTQQHGFGFTAGAPSGASASTLAAWRAGIDHPGDIVCVGPKYQYPYAPDTFHLGTRGYQLLGEKYGEVYFERVVLGRDWRPLQPVEVGVEGRVVRVRFHVPVPPLAWDDVLPAPHQTALTEWRAGRGFELSSSDGPLPIESVAIEGDAVSIRSATDLPPGAVLGYAATSDGAVVANTSRRWGQLRDSDPVVGVLTRQAQPNYAVAFTWPLP